MATFTGGARPACSGYQKLERLGIRTIVSLQGHAKGALRKCRLGQERAGAHFDFIPFHINFVQTGLTGVSTQSLSRLFAAMRNAPKPIFITCLFGKDRTGAVVAIYRMKEGEMSFEEARKEALHYRLGSRFLGLRSTIGRFRDTAKLNALPAVRPFGRPSKNICREALSQ
jgi:protein tyrosine/serine phosphatase